MKTIDGSAFKFQLFRVKLTSLQREKIMQTKNTEQLSKIKHLKGYGKYPRKCAAEIMYKI